MGDGGREGARGQAEKNPELNLVPTTIADVITTCMAEVLLLK